MGILGKLRGLSFGNKLFWGIMLVIGTVIFWLMTFDKIVGMWPSILLIIAMEALFLYLTRKEKEEFIDFEATDPERIQKIN